MSPPKHIVSAAAIVLNDKNELLLIKGPRRGWEMPGGGNKNVKVLRLCNDKRIYRSPSNCHGYDVEKHCYLFSVSWIGGAILFFAAAYFAIKSNKYGSEQTP